NQTAGRQQNDISRDDLFHGRRLCDSVANNLRVRSNPRTESCGGGLSAVLSRVADTDRGSNDQEHDACVDPLSREGRCPSGENEQEKQWTPENAQPGKRSLFP